MAFNPVRVTDVWLADRIFGVPQLGEQLTKYPEIALPEPNGGCHEIVAPLDVTFVTTAFKTCPGFALVATEEVVTVLDCCPSIAFAMMVKVYDVPRVRPVIVSDVSPAPGWFVIVQLGVQVTVYPLIPAPT